MAMEVTRSVGCTVHEACDDSTEVTKACGWKGAMLGHQRGANSDQWLRTDMHSDTNGTLGRPSDIVPIPCHTHGNIRVDTANEEDNNNQQSRMDRGNRTLLTH